MRNLYSKLHKITAFVANDIKKNDIFLEYHQGLTLKELKYIYLSFKKFVKKKFIILVFILNISLLI